MSAYMTMSSPGFYENTFAVRFGFFLCFVVFLLIIYCWCVFMYIIKEGYILSISFFVCINRVYYPFLFKSDFLSNYHPCFV